MTPRIDLIYFSGCPQVEGARSRIRAALLLRGLPATWQEWDTVDAGISGEYGRYGSPTILVEGRDVADLPIEDGLRCVAAGPPTLARLLSILDEVGVLR